jgi:hypothetical protein
MKHVLVQVLTKETGNCNTTTISQNFCQTVLNMWNWIVPHTTSKLQHNCSATLGRLRNFTPRKLNKPFFSRVGCLVSCLSVIYGVVQTVRKVDEASNSAFVQLIEPEPGLKIHSDYAWSDKVDLVWERILHKMKERGSYIFCD